MKSPLHWLKKKYTNFKIQTKLTLSHLIIVSIPMIALIVFFALKLYGMIVADTISNEQKSARQTIPYISQAVDRVMGASDGIMKEQFYKDLVDPRRTESFVNLVNSPQAQSFQERVSSYIKAGAITDVKMYMDVQSSEALFTGGYTTDIFKSVTQAQGTYWHGIFQGTPTTNYLFCPSFYLSPSELDNYGDMAYITKFSIMYDGNYTPCYMAVYFSQDTLKKVLKDTLTTTSNVAYLINDRNITVAASDDVLASFYHFNYDDVESHFMSSDNFIPKQVMGSEVYTGFYSVPHTNWYMVVAMPSAPMYTKSNSIVAVFIFIYLICIIIALFLASRLSMSLTRRLRGVAGQMTKARTELPVPLPPSTVHDEIGEVINSYNYMSQMIRALADEQATAAEDLRIAEFNSLQAQINPHFLYNTMDMINWLSSQGKPQEVTRAIQQLSRFYKLTLSRKNSLSTVEDELEHARIYVALQNMRFDDQIDLVIDIPDQLLDNTIPKLTLQPVIENAILHGLFEKESKQGTILITGWADGQDICLLVADDGVGIPPEKLATILAGTQAARDPAGSRGSNIAIYNTHRRFQVLYGPAYGLTYRSQEGKGTEVEIRLPRQTTDEAAPGADIVPPAS